MDFYKKELTKKEKEFLKNKIFDKKGQLKKVYKNKIYKINESKKIYPKQWISKRNLSDDYIYFIDIIHFLEIPFTNGNDAPRGGINGDFILLKSRTKFNNFVKKHN